jgi:adenine-specific DNA-methyltransferase
MIRNRLELLKGLLTDDGSIWISIDDNECHYMKVLCDEVFGRANFITTIIWQQRTSRENRKVFSNNHEYILVYARSASIFGKTRNDLPLNDEVKGRYKNPNNDPRGLWQSVSANAQSGHGTANQFYILIAPNGKKHELPKGRCWLYTKERMNEEIQKNNIWFGSDGNGVPRIKKYLSGVKAGLTPETLWLANDVGTNDHAKKMLIDMFSEGDVFDTPKPESLIKQVFEISTNPGDLILDSFAGSGTTGAVAHKMGRRWIMVELGEHCHTHIIPRMQKVIDGTDQGGISKAVDWKGGGGFRYYRLAPSLLEKDAWGNWVINKQYNAAMLAEAMCKHEGFNYAPSDSVFWNHGSSTERDFIFVTTQTLTREQLEAISEEVGLDKALLICCGAFRVKPGAFPNLTLKKIPNAVLSRCEFGKDDYSIQIASLPPAEPDEAASEESKSTLKGNGKKKTSGALPLFDKE